MKELCKFVKLNKNRIARIFFRAAGIVNVFAAGAVFALLVEYGFNLGMFYCLILAIFGAVFSAVDVKIFKN